MLYRREFLLFCFNGSICGKIGPRGIGSGVAVLERQCVLGNVSERYCCYIKVVLLIRVYRPRRSAINEAGRDQEKLLCSIVKGFQ